MKRRVDWLGFVLIIFYDGYLSLVCLFGRLVPSELARLVCLWVSVGGFGFPGVLGFARFDFLNFGFPRFRVLWDFRVLVFLVFLVGCCMRLSMYDVLV